MLVLLKKYLPDLLGYVTVNKSFTDRLDKFNIRYQNLKNKLATEGDSAAKINSIYEWIMSAESGDSKSAAYLNFVNYTVKNIFTKINATLEVKLKSIITNFLLSFDTDITLKNNPAYLNYLGELFIINRMLSDPGKFRLEGIEFVLPNKKKADVLVRNMTDGTKVLFDVVSINGFQPLVPESDNDVLTFFEAKYNQKLETKTLGLTETFSGNRIVVGKEEFKFAICPIIWNELKDLTRWSNILTIIETKYENVLPLSILYASQDNNEQYIFNFTPISEALKAIFAIPRN